MRQLIRTFVCEACSAGWWGDYEGIDTCHLCGKIALQRDSTLMADLEE
jgi:hypothetical protein